MPAVLNGHLHTWCQLGPGACTSMLILISAYTCRAVLLTWSHHWSGGSKFSLRIHYSQTALSLWLHVVFLVSSALDTCSSCEIYAEMVHERLIKSNLLFDVEWYRHGHSLHNTMTSYRSAVVCDKISSTYTKIPRHSFLTYNTRDTETISYHTN